MSFLESSWEEREEISYRNIFGSSGSGIYPLSRDIFTRVKVDAVDPRWLTHGVFKYPGTAIRKTWAYVTSGMSNPWESEDPQEYSGLGTEFVMETEDEADWAIEVLQTLMAYNLLLAAGKMGDFPLLDYGDRVPLALSDSIKAMLLTSPVNFPESFNIRSGKVDLIQIVGITGPELDVAKATSSDELKERIIIETGGLITKKERLSVVLAYDNSQ
jgi:hypothetical protein